MDNDQTPADLASGDTAPEDATPAQDAAVETPTESPAEKPKPKRKTKPRRSSKKKTAKATRDDSAGDDTNPEAAADVDDSQDESPEDASPDDEASSDDDSDDGASKRSKKTPRKKSSKKTSKKTERRTAAAKTESTEEPPAEMLVNYAPGEECRIAIVEDGQLEEFYSEPTNAVSRVGNIYVGKVTNVERAIQAAFVDFGTEENGFLHVSDLHPQYFPGEGEETKERVGKKTPRRSRPPIEHCLKRGQEIIVQVLKEGVGTKGPTLTSYLSIPGRFLVMMPQMDRVGVSRKEEDDDKRRAAKKILDQLDLPEEFGFILRTAGLERTKTELKRDLAYLQRLWKDMETKRKKGKAPRLLYTESDLLLRSLRDLLTNRVTRVVIDSEAAINRAAKFIKIVAPRSGAKLVHYQSDRPIFHAFGVEDQIRQIHAREVPLPSGGRLVIDQTEALVAIDVNSGKSRKAGDAESNAYNTNVEAVDVICRQLRLRDLGGLVISDLIDMRHASHRKDIENRFKERLKRDRARSTILPISQFGILEMTRQRMRGSQESMHFADCPTCHGRGLVQRPDSVAADAMRELADLIDHDKVYRVEVVVHPRVAGALLSTRRQSLTRVELMTGKHVDVRISDAIPLDRATFYAYDETGSDIELSRLPKKRPEPDLVDWDAAAHAGDSWAVDLKAEAEQAASTGIAELAASVAEELEEEPNEFMEQSAETDDDDQPKKKRRRRRRGGRGRRKTSDDDTQDSDESPSGEERESSSDDGDSNDADDSSDDQPKKKRRRRRRRGGRGRSGDSDAGDNSDESSEDSNEQPQSESDDEDGAPKKKRRRRGGRGRKKTSDGSDNGAPESDSKGSSKPAEAPAAEVKPKRRSLYGAGRRKLSASEVQRITPDK
ncbi:MAG: Rne/Rng family ribonuclease [Phycisphaerales bacterium]